MIEIGSSHAPAILGVSPHLTPWQLAARLTGLIPDTTEETEAMEFGTRLQGEILRAFCQRTGWIIEKEQPQYRAGFRRATPDGLLVSYVRDEDRTRLALAEVKCVTGQPPDVPRVDWLVQCLHQRWTVGCFEEVEAQYLIAFGGLRMVWWEVPYHDRAIRRVLDEEQRFVDNLQSGILPPVRAADAAVLSKAWPFVKPEPRILDAATLDLIRRFEIQKRDENTVRAEREQTEAEVKALIGDAAEAVWPDGTRYSFKPYTVKEQVRKAHTARPLKRVSGPSEEVVE